MKNTTWIILLLISTCHLSFSQADSDLRHNNIDTLETHYHNINWQSSNGKFTYYENGNKISKSKYDALSKEIIDPNMCTPCYLFVYKNDQLIYEGDFYTDCGVGLYIDYFSNGKVKTRGEYKRNLSQNWNLSISSEWCAIKNGLWEYFDESGNLIKSEQYENGIIKE